MNNAFKSYLHLIRATLNNEKIPSFDFEQKRTVFNIARLHHFLHFIYDKSVEIGLINENDEFYKALKDDYVLNKTRDIRQLVACDEVFNAFSKNGIRVMPLKGLVLKELYPETYLRRMNDLDILIDAQNSKKAKDILSSLGYRFIEDGAKHFSFVKGASVALEVHTMLFEDDTNDLFKDVWKKSTKGEGTTFYMCAEDLYLHTVLHYGEHFLTDGIGLRAVTDIYVLDKAYPNLANDDAFLERLDKSGYLEFFKCLLQVSNKWFLDQKPQRDLTLIEKYLLSSGTFGKNKDRATQYANKLTDSDKKSKVILDLLFPKYSDMCLRFKFLKKAPILLPFCWIIRIVRAPSYTRANRGVLTELAKVTPEEIKKRKEIVKEFGLQNK